MNTVYFEDVYTQFLRDITSITLAELSNEEIQAECESLLMNAITQFKFPKVSLQYEQDETGRYYFTDNVTQAEISVLLLHMGVGWIKYQLLNEDNFTPQYYDSTTRTYSKSAMIAQLNRLYENLEKKAKSREYDYGRTRDYKPTIGNIWQ